MSEPTHNETEEKPGARFGYLRNQYAPHRETAQKILKESGVNPKTGEFRRARRKFAGKLLETQSEGEIDALTGILNEKGFNRRFNEESERIKRSQETATLLYIDANNLKLTNDKDGHKAGDELLKKISSTLSGAIRRTDVLARLHGDEFAAILVGTDLVRLQELWDERINVLLQKEGLSIAVGASVINPDDLGDSKHRADTAMYRAKELSKQGVNEGEKAKISSLVTE